MIKPRFAGQAAGPFRFAIPVIAGSGLIGGTLYYRSQHKKAAPDTTHNKAHASAKRDKEGLSGAGIGGTAVTGGHETGQIGSGVGTANASPERRVESDAPKEKLPSGGGGGGVGGGGANVRTIEMSAKESQPLSENEKASLNMTPTTENSDSSPGPGDDVNSVRSRAGGSPATALQKESVDTKQLSRSYPRSTLDTDSSSSHGSSSSSSSLSGTTLSASQRLQSAFGQGGASAGSPGENTRKYHDTRVESSRTDIPSKRPQMRSDS